MSAAKTKTVCFHALRDAKGRFKSHGKKKRSKARKSRRRKSGKRRSKR